MQLRKLGSDGPLVSSIGLGCMGMSEFYAGRDENESVATLKYAVDNGVNFLDTADIYGPFTNEELVGKTIKGVRDQLVIATKFGIVRDKIDTAFRGINGRPEYVKAACDASLKRLKIDEIDLYYQHRVDPSVPIEETVGAMSDLIKAGKIKYIGLSEASSDTLIRANSVHKITALQSEYSLWSRDPEDDVLQTCRDLGIAFVAYSPLGRGFLTGQIKSFDDLEEGDYRRTSPRFQAENFQKNLELVKQIERMARDKECTPAQLALAWVLTRGEDVVPIPGTKRRSFMKENLGALKVILTKDDLERIDEIAPRGAAIGSRYTDAAMKLVNR